MCVHGIGNDFYSDKFWLNCFCHSKFMFQLITITQPWKVEKISIEIDSMGEKDENHEEREDYNWKCYLELFLSLLLFRFFILEKKVILFDCFSLESGVHGFQIFPFLFFSLLPNSPLFWIFKDVEEENLHWAERWWIDQFDHQIYTLSSVRNSVPTMW